MEITKIQCKECGKIYKLADLVTVSGQPDTVLFRSCDQCVKKLEKETLALHRCVMEDLR